MEATLHYSNPLCAVPRIGSDTRSNCYVIVLVCSLGGLLPGVCSGGVVCSWGGVCSWGVSAPGGYFGYCLVKISIFYGKTDFKPIRNRSGTVNSKSFVGKDLLRIKWNFELTVHF